MTPLHAIVLAIIQGITEFLPISSSGHLILLPRFLGWPDQGLEFDAAMHIGTLAAVVFYFRGATGRDGARVDCIGNSPRAQPRRAPGVGCVAGHDPGGCRGASLQ